MSWAPAPLSFLGVSGKRSGRRLGASFLTAPPFRSQPENLSLLFSPTLNDSLFSSTSFHWDSRLASGWSSQRGGVLREPEGGCGLSSHHSTSGNTQFLDLTLGYLGCASSEKWDLNQEKKKERERLGHCGRLLYNSGSEP